MRHARKFVGLLVGTALAAAMSVSSSSAATGSSVVGATVPATVSLVNACTDPAGYDFGTVPLATTQTTATGAGVCSLQFGSSNDTAQLRLWRRGGGATGMSRMVWSGVVPPGTSTTIWRVDSPSPQVVWSAGANGRIYRSDDAGATWTQQVSNTTDTIMGFDAVDDDVAWGATWAGTMLRTIDGGVTWTVMTNTGTTARLNHVAAIDADTVYATEWGGRVLKTTDGGLNWSLQSPPTPDPTNDAIWAFDESSLLVAGAGSTVLRSDDGGATWTSWPRPFTGVIHDFEAVGDVVWASLGSGQVMRSDDRGLTWTGWTLPASVTFEGIDARTAHEALVVGSDRTVFGTDDGGLTWRRYDMGVSTNNLTSVVWLDDLRAVAIGNSLETWRLTPAAGPSDFGAGGTWQTGTSAFGVCLQDVSLDGVVDAWVEDTAGATPNQCVAQDTDPWNALPATPTGIARTAAAGQDGRVDLVWGFRTASDQAAGHYRAPLVFEVVAPAA